MKKLLTVATAAALALGLLSTGASAAGNASISFDPGSPVVEGTAVTLTVETTAADTSGNQNLRLYGCYAKDADLGTAITSQPLAAAECPSGTGDTSGSTLWSVLKSEGVSNNTAHSFTYATSTANLGGRTAGFRAVHTPVGGNALSDVTADLTITVAPALEGDSHPGCKGVENAQSRVSDKGNAKNALATVAAKLGC